MGSRAEEPGREGPSQASLDRRSRCAALMRLNSYAAGLSLAFRNPFALESGFLEMITNSRGNAERSTFKA